MEKGKQKTVLSKEAEIEKRSNEAEIKKATGSDKLIAVIRISGMVKVNNDIEGTLDRLRLRRKYSCVLVDGKEKNVRGMLEKVRFYVAYGEIDDETLTRLIKKRGESISGRKNKLDVKEEEVIKGLRNGKKLRDFSMKEFFRLHPPRKGIDSKRHFPKGVLGNNKKDINKLLGRMI